MAHEAQADAPATEQLGPAVVKVEDVAVSFTVVTDRHDSTLRRRFARQGRSGRYEEVTALNGVSMTLRQGEVVGLIGPNGSGKSTLVRTIAGLHQPNRGTVEIAGRPTLLGVGAVLQPKLSGARNVVLGCLALGMSRSEARERFNEIVGFAGLEEAIDRPMRTYSSGMRARLHFAIATSVDPEILLVDEVLAVGDREFRRRSLRRLEQLRSRAGAVLMVTHSLGQVRKIATRAIYLSDGKILADGDPREVVRFYKKARK